MRARRASRVEEAPPPALPEALHLLICVWKAKVSLPTVRAYQVLALHDAVW